ncbi:MAG: helix-turn-helix transcriptional regulator [Selenomonadaceae bacterium]|nr:helix-turn-helix transcriptional regulator [Selenomonadaceae bacterium]
MSVASNIAYLRKNFDMTQKELSERTGINQSVLSRIENGTRPVRDDELKIFADFFNVSTDYLLDKETTVAEFSRDETNLIYDYRWLDSDSKNLVLGMIKRLRVISSPKSNKSVIRQNSENGSNFGVVGGNFDSNVTVRQ